MKKNHKTRRQTIGVISIAISFLLGFAACAKDKQKRDQRDSEISENTEIVSTTEEVTEEQSVPDYSDRIIPRADAFDGGDGSEKDPFRISTKEQLSLLRYMYSDELNNSDHVEFRKNSGLYFTLTEDIYLNDLSDYDSWGEKEPENLWFPIGDQSAAELNFDGGGHTIYGMYVDLKYVRNNSQGHYAGLFGSIKNSVIQNVNIEKGYIRQDYIEGENHSGELGGITGDASGSLIENCNTDVHFEVGWASNAGGICGYMIESVVRGCAFYGEFKLIQDGKLYAKVGGIAGSVGISGSLISCINQGTVSYIDNTEDPYRYPEIGGIVSRISPGSIIETEGSMEIEIKNCINEMSMDIGYCDGAGIVSTVGLDANYASVVIDNCENKADISSSSVNGVGGLVYLVFCSEDRDGTQSFLIKNCNNQGEIKGTSCSGGIVSAIKEKYAACTIQNCKNTGNVTSQSVKENANNAAGGIIAATEVSSEDQLISGCVNEGQIRCVSGFTGGVIGMYQGFSSVNLSTESAGCKIEDCQNFGTVQNDKGQFGTGGILGGVLSSSPRISIEKCINNGRIGGIEETCAGGIVGKSDSVYASSEEGGIQITSCVNKGVLFVGSNVKPLTSEGERMKRDRFNDVEESYKTGSDYVSVNSGSTLGGLLGRTRGALVEKSVNIGTFEADDEYLVMDSMDDYLFQSKVNELHTGVSKPLFVCGIVGGKLKGTSGNSGTLTVNECYYANNCYRGVIDDSDYDNETMYDTKRLSSEDAEAMAEQVMNDN